MSGYLYRVSLSLCYSVWKRGEIQSFFFSFADSLLRKNIVQVNQNPVESPLNLNRNSDRSISDSFPKTPLRSNNEKVKISEPFSLDQWIAQHKDNFTQGSPISLFPDRFQTRVYVISHGQHTIDCSIGDVWLWQHVRL